MQTNVGIPRALLYYEFGDLWTTFLGKLETKVTVSSKTTKKTLDRGTALAIDESCLPLKLYLGHVESLLESCTHIFVPRITSYHPGFFLCAKFAGLPDIIRNTFRLPDDKLITPNAEKKSWLKQLKNVENTCLALNTPWFAGYQAYNKAKHTWRNNISPEIVTSTPKIAIIGHSYLLQDEFFSGDILSTLTSRGIAVLTPEHIPAKTLYQESLAFQPDIYWQLSAKIAGATRYFCRQPDITGIVMVSSFGCGPDSLVNEYVEHHILKNSEKPYIIINLDEHTGTAGVVTRLEAFGDLLDWRGRT